MFPTSKVFDRGLGVVLIGRGFVRAETDAGLVTRSREMEPRITQARSMVRQAAADRMAGDVSCSEGDRESNLTP